jgi:hypothetical protein
VLVSDIATYREIAPSQALFSLDTPDSLAKKIDSLDDASYQELVCACSEKVKSFASINHVRGFYKLFKETINV